MVEPLGGVIGAASPEADSGLALVFLRGYSLSRRPFQRGQVGWAHHWSPAVGSEGLPCNIGSVRPSLTLDHCQLSD